ncbi:MAG: cellulase family glycosylhydrolase [Myxococcota bacterium]
MWGEWADLAGRGARAVLAANPNLLVFVQGASYLSAGAAYDVIHGESLVHSEVYPPDIPPSRLVYAPHAYGPDVFALNYLASPQYPKVLPYVWELRFGHAFTAGHGLVIGEFGGHYDDAVVPGSVDWQDRFVAWMAARGIDSFFYWCWNPNSGNTGGILEDDWKTPNAAKMKLLRPLLDD